MPKDRGVRERARSSRRRMDEWQQQMDQVHNQADLIIAKQRHGPTGTIQLFFEAEFTRFADLDLHPFRVMATADTAPARFSRSISARSSPTGDCCARMHPSGPVAGVVKADGYGLGARPVAPALYAAGCRHFFVATAGRGPGDPRGSCPDAMLAVLGGLIAGSEADYRRARHHPGARLARRDRRLAAARAPSRPRAAGVPAFRYRHVAARPRRARTGGAGSRTTRGWPGIDAALRDDASRCVRGRRTIR